MAAGEGIAESVEVRAAERLEHLEKVNRWHMSALEVLASMGDMHGTGERNDPFHIFSITRRYLARFIDFEATAFLTVGQEDADFHLVDCLPRVSRAFIETELDRLITNGRFAWCLHNNRAVEVSSKDEGHRLILHVLASRTRVNGMFIGALAKGVPHPSAAMLQLLSIILHHSSHALESCELNRLILEQNRNLEQMVEARTRELEHQYGHDRLTGLPNRLLFQDRMEQAMSRALRHDEFLAILVLDLDMFKRINDTLGHAAGDALLTEVAERIRHACVARDVSRAEGQVTVARLGGDEFGILITELQNLDPITRAIKRIIEALSRRILLDGHELYVTTSIGVSLYPHDGRETETLLRNADVAMYHAKRQGRNNYQFYARDMHTASFQQLFIENQLRRAVQHEEFVLHYQPKIEADSGTITGVEALVRWDHPEMGLVSPADFIPVAEYTGLIVPIGGWVLREACRQARIWLDGGVGRPHVAVNLSAQQFRRSDLLGSITAVLEETGLPAHCLELEITESTIMEDVEAAVATMHGLHELGIRLSIDDFGTGYSSLNYLKRFPIDTLKIDGSFIRDVTEDADDAAIVTAIVAMARSMGLRVVAEGVENAAQEAFLHTLRCDEIQGFLYSPPIPADEATRMLGENLPLRSSRA
jgi:diguanylate cyclase (GGDEF)-like protein